MAIPRPQIQKTGCCGVEPCERGGAEEGDQLVFGGGVVEPDCAFVGGVGGVVGGFAGVEGVPAVGVLELGCLKAGGKGQGRMMEERGTYYSFVPSSEGSSGAGVAGVWSAIFGGCFLGNGGRRWLWCLG